MTHCSRSLLAAILASALSVLMFSAAGVSAGAHLICGNGTITLLNEGHKILTLTKICLTRPDGTHNEEINLRITQSEPSEYHLGREAFKINLSPDLRLDVRYSEASKRFDISAISSYSTKYIISIEGEIAWQNRLLCRLTPDSNPYMVQTSLGPLSSTRCNSLFDISADRALTFIPQFGTITLLPDKSTSYISYIINASTEIDSNSPARVFSVKVTEGVYRAKGIKYYTPIDKNRFPLPPSGWCSWYYYYQNIKEGDIRRNADWIAKNLKPFGAEYIQLDDGWQGIGHGSGENRDWETIDRRFSGGMKALSDYIHSLKMKSGLWLAPHGQSSDTFVMENRDAFIWRSDGTSIGYKLDPKTGKEIDINWEGRYIVDTSGKAGQDYMHRLFDRLANGYGFDYFKIDGQPIVESLYRNYRNGLDSSKADPLDSYRAGLSVIRKAIGSDRFLLGCWGTPLSGIGIMNGSRTGGDVAANWKGFAPAFDATLNNYYLHNIVWYCDPDVLCVRSPLSISQAQAWASLYGLTGQILMAGDRMYSLPADRVEILKRVFPAADIRPVDLYPYRKKVDTWDLKVSKPWGSWDVVGLFNWEATAKRLELDLDSLGNIKKGGRYHLFDFWEHRYLGELSGRQGFDLPPTSCKVLAVSPVKDRPQVISTSRHITQGWIDLRDVSWDSAKRELSGTSTVVGNDLYTLYTIAPPGFAHNDIKYKVLAANNGEHIETKIDIHGALIVLNIVSPASGDISWSLSY